MDAKKLITFALPLLIWASSIAANTASDYTTVVKVGDAPAVDVMNGVLWTASTSNEKLIFVVGMQNGLLLVAGTLNELGHTSSAKDAEDIIKMLSGIPLSNNQIARQMDKIYSGPINARLPAFEVFKAAIFQLSAVDGFDKDQLLSLLRRKYAVK